MTRTLGMQSILLIAITSALVGCGGETAPDDATSTSNRPQTRSAPASQPPGVDHPPIVESVVLSPAEPSAGDTLRADVKVTDPDGDHVSVAYSWWVNGRKVEASGSSFELVDVSRGNRVDVSVVATAAQAQSEAVIASVSLGNSAPEIEEIRFEPSGDWFAGQNVAAIPQAVDADGDPMTFEFRWRMNGQPLDESGPTLAASTFERGDQIELEVRASDGHADSAALTVGPFRVANSAPEVRSEPGAIGRDGVFRYQVEVDDADGDRSFMYKLVQKPSGMEIDNLSGKVTWKPTPEQSGNHPVSLEVDDRMGGRSTQQFTLSVSFDGKATPPPASPN